MPFVAIPQEEQIRITELSIKLTEIQKIEEAVKKELRALIYKIERN